MVNQQSDPRVSHININKNKSVYCIIKYVLRQIVLNENISPRIVFSNRPDLDQIVSDKNIFIGPIVVLNRLEKVIGYCF